MRIIPLLIGLICLTIINISCSKRSDFDIRNDKIRSLIKEGTDSIHVSKYFPDRDVRNHLHKEFNEFYKFNQYNLAWLKFDEPQEQTDEFLEALDAAPEHGLKSDNYDINEIETLLQSIYNIDSKKERRKRWRNKLIKTEEYREKLREEDTLRFQQIARLDFLLTATYLTYGSHLLSGRIDPNEKKEWFAPERTADLSKHLAEALDKGKIRESLEALAPSHKQYSQLRNYLVHFRNVECDTIPTVTTPLRKGDRGKEVLNAKKRLSQWKNIDPNYQDSLVYDEAMVNAVKQFQRLHGLQPNGRVDQPTLVRLNTSIALWVSKIETNMERMRWLHEDFGDQYILVNIPSYQLQLMHNGEEKIRMKVIVGTDYKKTPVFSDSLEYIVFNPTWTVPNTIATEEMLPQIKEDPEYLEKRNLELYESWARDADKIDPKEIDWSEVDSADWKYKVVEVPGPSNSLGRIKFMMPNSEDIYLHDTPANHLFSKDNRTFSHGCVRLEKPATLAQYLLDWDADEVQEYIDREETDSVVLDEKMPVHIVYWSAWVDDSGMINFRNDVYHHDREQRSKIELKERKIVSSSP